MANQPQPRPWFRLPSLARPIQPPGPPSPQAPRPQMQPPTIPLPRPTMTRPTFRPPVNILPQPPQDTTPPLQFPRPRVPPPQQRPVAATASPVSPSPAVVSPLSPPKPLPRINTSSSVTQKSPPASPTRMSTVSHKSPPASSESPKSPLPASPVTIKSHLASPVTQKSPFTSPVTQKYPSPRSSPIPPSSSLPSSSQPKTQSPSPSNLPFPAIKQEVATSIPESPAKHFYPYNVLLNKSTPVSSSRIAKPLPETPPESPKIQPALYSPPLFSLPPSQLKSDGEYARKIPAISEQKTVHHIQDRVNNLGKHAESKERENKRAAKSEDIARMVISISGENKGAVMELGYSPRTTHGKPHSFVGGYHKLRSDGMLSEGNLNDNEMHDTDHTAKANPSMPMRAFMNSNVQGVNGSIVFNSSLSNHDPGVHFSVARKPVKSYLKEPGDVQNLFRKEA